MSKSIKGTRTEANLLAAFAGESQARNKYTYYASKAKKEGYEQIAALFTETAENEKEHAKIWFKQLHDGAHGRACQKCCKDGPQTKGAAQKPAGGHAKNVKQDFESTEGNGRPFGKMQHYCIHRPAAQICMEIEGHSQSVGSYTSQGAGCFTDPAGGNIRKKFEEQIQQRADSRDNRNGANADSPSVKEEEKGQYPSAH